MGNDIMEFPEAFELFISQYKFKDKEEVYTNGSDLIPTFRVMQGWEHYTQKLRDKQSREIMARNRCIVDSYSIILELLPDFDDPAMTSDLISKLNKLYEDVEDFKLQDAIDQKVLKS